MSDHITIADRIAKLPAWAKIHIGRLECRIQDLRLALNSHRGDLSKTEIDALSMRGRYIPNDSEVRFDFDDGSYVEVRRSETTNTAERCVRVSSSRRIVVAPACSNLVEIRVADW